MSEFDLPPEDIAQRLSTQQRLELVGQTHGMTPRQANAITKARMQLALSQLAEANVDNIQRWLGEVGSRSPAEAIRLYMELLEFTAPRLKAAQVNLNANADMTPGGARSMADMSIDELSAIVSEQ